MHFPTFQRKPRLRRTTLLSLPPEILTEILIYVSLEQFHSQDSRYIGHGIVPIKAGTTVEDLIPNLSNPAYLSSVMRTCRRLRQVAYPLFYERLSVGHLWRRSQPAIERVPIAAIPKLLEIIDTDPHRAEVVRILHIRENWDEMVWETGVWKGRNKRKESERQRMISVLQRIARKNGLHDERFMAAIKEGREDMIIALLLFSLPKLKEIQLKLNLCGWKFGKAYLRRTHWIEEALSVATPRCSATLARLNYSKYATRSCMWSWCPAVWQLMKFPHLRSFEARNISVENAPQNKPVEGERDENKTRSMTAEQDSTKFNNTAIIPGQEQCSCHTPQSHAEKTCWIPSQTTCRLTHLDIRGFNTYGIHLDKIIAAPRALKSLYLLRGNHHISERAVVGKAILSQASSLRELHLDIGGVYARSLIHGLTSLTHLTVDNRIFLRTETTPDDYASALAADPNSWLPTSIVELRTICSGGCGSYSSEAVGEALCRLSPTTLPQLKSVAMEVYLNQLSLQRLRSIGWMLGEHGIDFGSQYVDELGSDLSKSREVRRCLRTSASFASLFGRKSKTQNLLALSRPLSSPVC